MPFHDDDLRALGQSVHHDPRFGRFVTVFGTWRLNTAVDFPFQQAVPIIFELNEEKKAFPASMPDTIQWIQEHLGEIWNAAAQAVNNLIEAEQIQVPDAFKLEQIWVSVPDGPVQDAIWTFQVEPAYMTTSFEIVFHGLRIISQVCHD